LIDFVPVKIRRYIHQTREESEGLFVNELQQTVKQYDYSVHAVSSGIIKWVR
jgi:hypothetical protein